MTFFSRCDPRAPVTSVTFCNIQGQGCSSCSGGQGTFTYAYSLNSDAVANYGTAEGSRNYWVQKCVQTLPDSTTDTYYYNYFGQQMLKVVSDGTHQWGTFSEFDSAGRVILTAQPSAVALPSSLSTLESYDDLLHSVSGNYQYLNDSSGLIATTTYAGATTATFSTPGDIAGFASDTYVKNGETGTAIHQEHFTYWGSGNDPIAADTVYGNADGTDARTTSTAYSYYGGTRIKLKTITYPNIDSSHNGPNSADTMGIFYDTFGRPIWSKDGDGHVNYTAYDLATDGIVKTITDVNYSSLTTAEQTSFGPTGWSTSISGLNLVTTYTVDGLGRMTKMTSPAGNVTYTVYNDVNHEVRTYPGFVSGATTGPIIVSREYFPAANSGKLYYTESLTTSATPHLTSSVPDGTETISASNIQSLSRDFYNGGGQVIWSDKYFSFAGLTYSQTVSLSSSVPADIGTSGTNFYRTTFGYDEIGNNDEVVAPTGTINRTVYDGLGRITSRWVGTTDTHSGDDWTPSSNTGNMMKLEDDEYDGGGVGDSNLTKVTQHVDASSGDDRVTSYLYDFEDREVASKSGVQTTEIDGAHRPIIYNVLDNQGEAHRTYLYDGDGVSLSDFSTSATTDAIPTADASKVRALAVDSFDDQGRVYRTQIFSIDQSNGTSGLTDSQILALANLAADTFYDHRGNVIATYSAGGLVTKTTYDGAGRTTTQYTTDGGAVNNSNTQRKSWSDAGSVSNDVVLTQTELTYDSDSNVILATTRDRFDNDATSSTGALGSPSSGIGARVSYVADYYDAADRLTDQVNVGTNGGSSYTRPSSVPSRSDTVLVMHTAYDSAGNAYELTDPRNILTEFYFDMLGRVTGELDNSDGGSPATGSASTGYTYDGDGNVLTMTANLVSPVQTTAYVRGVGGTSGTNLFSNDLISKVEYPIKSGASAGQPDTTSSGSVSYSYDLLGEVLTATDQNGSVHTYTYDILGRLKLDAVTTLASGVDGSVRALGYSYTALGLPYQQTSYSNTGATTVVNQVQDAYNGYGQLTTQYQEHSGSVSTSTSMTVQYGYSQPSAANYSRLSSITYPNGRVEDYVYNSGLDSDISRVSGISDDAGTGTGSVESYKYLGIDTVVQRIDGNGIELTYIKQSGESNGDAGDQYIGLDRFGRVVDQRWIPTSSPSSPTDRFQYGYDRDGNLLYKNNLVSSSFSELYHANSGSSGDNATAYDKLNRITGFRRGTLSASAYNSGGLDTVSTLNTLSNSQQSFTLDAVGNQTSVTTDGTATSRTVNSQNQLTAVGSTSLAFDNNGNTTTDDQSHTLIYDAWNRLVQVKNGSTVLTSYTFDANGWRIKENPGTATDIYFSSAGQALEERQSTTVTNQYVWSLGYVNDIVLRDDNSTSGSFGKSSSGLGRRLYYQQDANYNVIAVTDTSGVVKQRYVYSPYGGAAVLTAAWGSTSEAYSNVYRFQGGRYDPVSGMSHFGARDYAGLGRWVQRDYAYWDGMNLYRFVLDNPNIYLDPSGLYSYGKPVFSGVQWDPSRKVCNMILTQYQQPSWLDKHTFLGRIASGAPTRVTKHAASSLSECQCNKYSLARLKDADRDALAAELGDAMFVEMGFTEGAEHAGDTAIALGLAALASTIGGILDAADSAGEVPGNPFRGRTAPDQAYKHLEKYHGVAPEVASERLHQIKQGAGLGAADDVIIGRTGDVYNAATGEWIGSMTQN